MRRGALRRQIDGAVAIVDVAVSAGAADQQAVAEGF